MGSVPKVIFVIGVSGCGKTSVGRQLGYDLQIPFIDADDYHPEANIEKMSQGVPLDDNDRQPWLIRLNDVAQNHIEQGCVIACSALKEVYRKTLSTSIEANIVWIYLKGDYKLIYERLNARKDHFMDADMLKSQFEALEEPEDAITIDIANPIKVITQKIKVLLS